MSTIIPMRSITAFLLVTACLAATGCGDDGDADQPATNNTTSNNANNTNNTANNANNANNQRNNTNQNNDTNNDDNTNNTNNTTKPMTWAGTWFIEVSYDITCEETAFGDSKSGVFEGSWSIELQGANSAITATVNSTHEMTGAGNDARLTLSGTFPLKGTQQAKTSPPIMRRNEISLKLDDLISQDEVHGSISGFFETDDITYDECKVNGGQVVMSR